MCVSQNAGVKQKGCLWAGPSNTCIVLLAIGGMHFASKLRGQICSQITKIEIWTAFCVYYLYKLYNKQCLSINPTFYQFPSSQALPAEKHSFFIYKNRVWSIKEKKNTCELGLSTTRGEPGPSLDYMNGIMELINLPLGQFSPEMEFLDINLTQESSRLLLHAIHFPFYSRILFTVPSTRGF